ncbi:MAG: helix-turn-helix domain-containing protein [Phycisphaeraceae bacterium]|nr:helix-turn-helix domain-containing protein [Phycisphaeraceae bacterium]
MGSTKQSIGPHQHSDLELNFLYSGTAFYIHSGRRVALKPGQIAMFWGAMPHQLIKSDSQTKMGWITLPLDWLWRCDCPADMFTNLLSGNMIHDPLPESQDGDNFQRWNQMLHQPDSRWKRIVTLEVEARIRRLAMALEQHTLPRPTRHKQSTQVVDADPVEKMAHYLSRNFRSTLTVEDVAKHVHLHPNYAMRLFKRHLDMTMIAYLTQQRIAEARRLLITTDEPILDIVFGSGFKSTSQFYQMFEKLVGESPRAYRNRVMQADR